MSVQITRRYFVKGLGLLAASAALGPMWGCASQVSSQSSSSVSQASSPMLAIIHTNDSHGHDVEVKATDDNSGNFSMAAVAQLKADWEAKGYDVLLVDAGDATQGMPLVDQSNGATAITFMNSCGYDLMTVGNHEFDRGDDNIASFEQEAQFPLISANVLLAETGELRFTPSKTFDLSDGTKVGIFGLTTPATMTNAKPVYTEKFRFLAGDDLFDCARKQVEDLRNQGCDLVICLGHLGNLEACAPSTSRELLNNVEGIDLFIDGHDHKLVSEEVAGTLLVETGCYMANIGVVVIDSGLPDDQSVPYGSYDGIDQATQSIIDQVDDQVESELNVVLGHTEFKLDGERSDVRSHETNLGDFVCDAAAWGAEQSSGMKLDGAVWNGGAIRQSIEQGEITLADIKEVFPFADQVLILKLTGAQLLEAIEASCQNAGEDSYIGAFPQVAGIKFTVDTTVPYEEGDTYPNSTYASPASPGSRVTIEQVGDRAWAADDVYSIATTEFLSQGGDTYYAFKQAADAEDRIMCDFDYEVFTGYLAGPCDHEVPETYAEPQGRITIIE